MIYYNSEIKNKKQRRIIKMKVEELMVLANRCNEGLFYYGILRNTVNLQII